MHLSAIADNLNKYLKFTQKRVKRGARILTLASMLIKMLYPLKIWLVSVPKTSNYSLF